MTPQRNDPCPCGSGRKYKHCCLALDQPEGPVGRLDPGVRHAAATEPWEADIVTFPFIEESRSKGGAAITLAMAGGFVLHLDIGQQPGPEPEDVAVSLSEFIREALRATGAAPSLLRVGDDEVAALLQPLVSGLGIGRVESGPLPQVVEAARALIRNVTGDDPVPPGAGRESWRHWGRSSEEIAALFRAAAAFFRAAPWLDMDSSQLVCVWTPAGRKWAVSVLGAGADAHGLAMYSDIEDVLLLFDDDTGDPWIRQRGRQYAVLFARRSELPRPMQKEVAVAGWEVATPDAYPLVLSVRSPGGGICAADWADLVAVLDAVPRVIVPALASHGPEHAIADRTSGMSFVVVPRLMSPGYAPVPLTPGYAEGPGADPYAALAGETAPEAELELLSGFREWLAARRLSTATLDKHTRIAGAFLHYLHHVAAVPFRAVHEFDLRDFLFDWIHRRSGLRRTAIGSAPAALTKFLAFLSDAHGIHCPWAAPVLSERDLFLERAETCPGGPFWDSRTMDWIGDLTADLDMRVMLPSDELGDDDEWGSSMGEVEWALHHELRRRWLLWRDELIRAGGVTDHDALLDELEQRQRAWQTAPNPKVAGRTPVEAVLAERAETAAALGGPDR